MGLDRLAISLSDIVTLCGVIGAIYGVIKIYKEVRKPSSTLSNMVEEHGLMLKNDFKRLNEVEESNKMMCKCMLVLLNHEITGNGIDKMKVARDELQEYLINK